MAAEESTAMSYEKIYDMGTGLIIAKVQLDKVREQDINARIMRKEMQDQLTANIKNRGQLESLPLLVEKDGVLEIISGHHRIKSASSAMREAGLDELYNSRKAAQQLEAALCPPVGDGSLLQPELFHMELQGALTALRDSDKPAVRAFVRDELAPLLENTELLRAYTGLMVGG